MDEEERLRLSVETTNAMRAHVTPFLTPVSRVLSETEGELVGTGSYVRWKGRVLLVTNEHVAEAREQHSLAHQFHGSEDILRLTEPMVAIPHPEDIAAGPIREQVWSNDGHSALAIPEDRFAAKHDPVDGELLFMAGYSGERSTFSFGHLVSRGTSYLTQECELPDDDRCGPVYHFAIHYRPDQAQVAGEERVHLPVPPGLSGSLVWDTKRLACWASGEKWSPDLAVVTGIIWGWPSSEACLIATRVEHLHRFLEELPDALFQVSGD